MALTGALSIALIGMLLALAVYMLIRNIHSRTHQSFSLFTFLVAGVLICGYIMREMSIGEGTALAAMRLYYILGVLVAPTFLIFAYNIAKKPVPKWILRTVPLGVLVLVILTMSGVFFTDMHYSEDTGYVPRTTVYDQLVDLINIGIALGGVLVLYGAYKADTSTVFKKQIRMIVTGVSILAVTAFLFMFLLPMSDPDTYEKNFHAANIGAITAMAGTWAFAILRYKMLLVEPRMEELRQTESKYHLTKGRCYYVKETEGMGEGKSFDVFTDLVTHGGYGLCLSTTNPDHIREAYKFRETPVIDLDGADISSVYNTIQRFCSSEKGTVVLLDGLGYLYANSSKWDIITYMKIGKLVRRITAVAKKYDSTIIIPLDRNKYDRSDYTLLKHSMSDLTDETKKRMREVEVTNRKLLDSLTELERSYRKLEKANEELTEEKERSELMTDLILHDVSNNDQIVLSNLEMLLMTDELPEEQQRYLRMAKNTIDRSVTLIEAVRYDDMERLTNDRLSGPYGGGKDVVEGRPDMESALAPGVAPRIDPHHKVTDRLYLADLAADRKKPSDPPAHGSGGATKAVRKRETAPSGSGARPGRKASTERKTARNIDTF